MHHIKDDKSKATIAIGEMRDEHRATIEEAVSQKSIALITNEDNPTNPSRQRGRVMKTHDFETKLLTILPPFCKIFDHPKNETKRCLYLITPSGEMEFLLAWEATQMPEFSVLFQFYEDVPDMSVTNISARDLPKYELNGNTGHFEFDTTSGPMPGMKRVVTVGSERIRGWRTVLLKLVSYSVITPTQAETTFGSSDRPEWATVMGKSYNPTPWCG